MLLNISPIHSPKPVYQKNRMLTGSLLSTSRRWTILLVNDDHFTPSFQDIYEIGRASCRERVLFRV